MYYYLIYCSAGNDRDSYENIVNTGLFFAQHTNFSLVPIKRHTSRHCTSHSPIKNIPTKVYQKVQSCFYQMVPLEVLQNWVDPIKRQDSYFGKCTVK